MYEEEVVEDKEERMKKGILVMYRRSDGTACSQWSTTTDPSATYADLFYQVATRIDDDIDSTDYVITNVIKL